MVLLLAVVLFGEKSTSLPGINNPKTIAVDHELLIITEGATIYMYTLKDFRLLKKFGKSGEGPREFIVNPNMPLRIKLLPDKFLANSFGKITYFTRQGEYLKEVKHSVSIGGADLFPVGDYFTALGYAREDMKTFITANIYDAEFKKVTEFDRFELPLRGPKFRIFEKAMILQTGRDRIYVSGSKDFIINIFDYEGKKVNTINREYEKLKFSDSHKQEALNFYKTSPDFKPYADMITANVLWPDYFQAIRHFIAADKQLYVQTYLEKDGKTEFYIFDHNGKFLGRKWVPLTPVSFAETLQLFTIYDHKIYQLVDNIDTEEWELHITDIK
jgi:hypothetical protein